jgi:cyclic pyranopterin phosphate synthase
VRAFSELGVQKIRLTGGEPAIRKDLHEIMNMIHIQKNIKQLALTTNGYGLKKNIHLWEKSGLTHLNISVDSLDPNIFHSLTGHHRLKEILNAIDDALSLSFKRVKINAVLLKNINHHQFKEYADYIKNRPLSIRFIELMQTGENYNYFKKYHVSAQKLKEYLITHGWSSKKKEKIAGPAIEYSHPDHQGTFGIIAPYSKDFCDHCNRLRVSSTGSLHLCLFGDRGYNLRLLLQDASQLNELKKVILETLSYKKKEHFLHDHNTGMTQNLSFIGG